MMISPEALHLWIFILPWSLLIILIGLCSVQLLGLYLSRRFSWSSAMWQVYKDSLWTAILIGLVAARLCFVAIHADVYFTHPIDILKIQDKGFHLYSGLAAASAWFIWKNRFLNYAVIVGSLAIFFAVQLGGLGIHKRFQTEQQYPELTFSDLNQQTQSLTQFVGQPTVINLWASWCPPCHREMPVLYQAQRDHPNVQFVMLNQGETPDVIKNYLRQHQFQFQHVLSDPHGEMAEQVNMFGLPSTLFFNAQGKLVERHLGELTPAMLKQYLQEITQLNEGITQ
ncbi:MAG: TlpA disulfide reductase family protein [Acinetobacter sp.]